MWVKKLFSVGLVLVLASAALWAWPTFIVGQDSRDALINEMKLEIRLLEDTVVTRESEIAKLQESLAMLTDESTGLMMDSQQLSDQLGSLKSQLENLKLQLIASQEELNALQKLLQIAQEKLNSPPPNELGGVFGVGLIYDAGALALEAETGLTYGRFGFTVGLLADIDADVYLPSRWRFKAGIQMYF